MHGLDRRCSATSDALSHRGIENRNPHERRQTFHQIGR